MTTALIAGAGPLELLIVLLIVLVLVGGRRLPALGRQLGEGVRGLADSIPRRADSRSDVDGSSRTAPLAPLGRPGGEETPLDGEVVRERS
jgi:hypothetical protein